MKNLIFDYYIMGNFLSKRDELYLHNKYKGYFEIIPWQYHGNNGDVYKRAHMDAYLRGGSVLNIDPNISIYFKNQIREAVSVFIKYSKIIHHGHYATDGFIIGYDDLTEADLWRDYNGNTPWERNEFDMHNVNDNPTILYDSDGKPVVAAYNKSHVYIKNYGQELIKKKWGWDWFSFNKDVLLYKNFASATTEIAKEGIGLNQLRLGYVFEKKPYSGRMKVKIERWIDELNPQRPFGVMRDFSDDELREIYKDVYEVVEVQLKKPAVFNTNIFYTYKEAWMHALNNNDIIASPQNTNENRAISLLLDDYNKKNETTKISNYLLGFYIQNNNSLNLRRFIDMHEIIWRNWKVGEIEDSIINHNVFANMKENIVAMEYNINLQKDKKDKIYSIFGDDEYVYNDTIKDLMEKAIGDVDDGDVTVIKIQDWEIRENFGNGVLNPPHTKNSTNKPYTHMKNENLWWHGRSDSDGPYFWEYRKGIILQDPMWDTHNADTFCSNSEIVRERPNDTQIKASYRCLGHKRTKKSSILNKFVPLHEETYTVANYDFERGEKNIPEEVSKHLINLRSGEHVLEWDFRQRNNFEGWELIVDLNERSRLGMYTDYGWMFEEQHSTTDSNNKSSSVDFKLSNIIRSPEIKNLDFLSTVMVIKSKFAHEIIYEGELTIHPSIEEMAIDISNAKTNVELENLAKQNKCGFMGIRDVETGKYVAYKQTFYNSHNTILENESQHNKKDHPLLNIGKTKNREWNTIPITLLLDFVFDGPKPETYEEKVEIWNDNIKPNKSYTIDFVHCLGSVLGEKKTGYFGLVGARLKGIIQEENLGYEWIDGNQIQTDLFNYDGEDNTITIRYIAEKNISSDVLFDRYLTEKKFKPSDKTLLKNIRKSQDVVFELNDSIRERMLLQLKNNVEVIFNKFDLESITLLKFIDLLKKKNKKGELIVNPFLDFVWRGNINSKGLMQGFGFLYIKENDEARIYDGYFDMGLLKSGKEYKIDINGKSTILYEGNFKANLLYKNNLNKMLLLNGINNIAGQNIEYEILSPNKEIFADSGGIESFEFNLGEPITIEFIEKVIQKKKLQIDIDLLKKTYFRHEWPHNETTYGDANRYEIKYLKQIFKNVLPKKEFNLSIENELLSFLTIIASILDVRYFFPTYESKSGILTELNSNSFSLFVVFFNYGSETGFNVNVGNNTHSLTQEKWNKIYTAIYVENVNIESLYKNPLDIRLKRIPSIRESFNIIKYNNEKLVIQEKINMVLTDKIEKLTKTVNNLLRIENVSKDIPRLSDENKYYPSFWDNDGIFDDDDDNAMVIIEAYKDYIMAFYPDSIEDAEDSIFTLKDILFYEDWESDLDYDDFVVFYFTLDEWDDSSFEVVKYFKNVFNLGKHSWIGLTQDQIIVLTILGWTEEVWDDFLVKTPLQIEEIEVVEVDEAVEEIEFDPEALNDGVLKDGVYWITGPNGIFDVSNANIEETTNVYELEDKWHEGLISYLTPITFLNQKDHHTNLAKKIEVKDKKIFDINGDIWSLNEESGLWEGNSNLGFINIRALRAENDITGIDKEENVINYKTGDLIVVSNQISYMYGDNDMEVSVNTNLVGKSVSKASFGSIAYITPYDRGAEGKLILNGDEEITIFRSRLNTPQNEEYKLKELLSNSKKFKPINEKYLKTKLEANLDDYLKDEAKKDIDFTEGTIETTELFEKTEKYLSISNMVNVLGFGIEVFENGSSKIKIIDEELEAKSGSKTEFEQIKTILYNLIDGQFYPSLTYNNRMEKVEENIEGPNLNLEDNVLEYKKKVSALSSQFINRDDISIRKTNWDFDLRYFFIRHGVGGLYLDNGEFYDTNFDNDIEDTNLRKLKLIKYDYFDKWDDILTKETGNTWFLEGSKYYNSIDELKISKDSIDYENRALRTTELTLTHYLNSDHYSSFNNFHHGKIGATWIFLETKPGVCKYISLQSGNYRKNDPAFVTLFGTNDVNNERLRTKIGWKYICQREEIAFTAPHQQKLIRLRNNNKYKYYKILFEGLHIIIGDDDETNVMGHHSTPFDNDGIGIYEDDIHYGASFNYKSKLSITGLELLHSISNDKLAEINVYKDANTFGLTLWYNYFKDIKREFLNRNYADQALFHDVNSLIMYQMMLMRFFKEMEDGKYKNDFNSKLKELEKMYINLFNYTNYKYQEQEPPVGNDHQSIELEIFKYHPDAKTYFDLSSNPFLPPIRKTNDSGEWLYNNNDNHSEILKETVYRRLQLADWVADDSLNSKGRNPLWEWRSIKYSEPLHSQTKLNKVAISKKQNAYYLPYEDTYSLIKDSQKDHRFLYKSREEYHEKKIHGHYKHDNNYYATTGDVAHDSIRNSRLSQDHNFGQISGQASDLLGVYKNRENFKVFNKMFQLTSPFTYEEYMEIVESSFLLIKELENPIYHQRVNNVSVPPPKKVNSVLYKNVIIESKKEKSVESKKVNSVLPKNINIESKKEKSVESKKEKSVESKKEKSVESKKVNNITNIFNMIINRD